MTRRVLIEALTRVEGHGRVTLRTDGEGRVADARVDAVELRGFEAICAGRPLREMPALTSRICGVCPAAHAHAAAAAGDAILGAEPPPAARALRRLLLLGGTVQSHATSFYVFSAPDLALRGDAAPPGRSVLALAEVEPELVRDGLLVRRFGGDVVERVGGRRVHPVLAVPGGVTHALDASARDALAAGVPRALAAVERTLGWWRGHTTTPAGASSRTGLRLAHVAPDGTLSLAGGALRVVSPTGEVVEDGLAPSEALHRVVERPISSSYAKLCAWRGGDGKVHDYRVGPVARLTAADRCGTPRAERALAELLGGAPRSELDAHAARLVELLVALERIDELLADPLLGSRELLAEPTRAAGEGVGSCEAPRGVLFHRYQVDADGLVTGVRIVAPTGQNGRAMNAAVRAAARRVGPTTGLSPELRDAAERAIRAFDPCLSCATHAIGGGGIPFRLVGPDGRVLDEWPSPR